MTKHRPEDAGALDAGEFAEVFQLAILAGERPQDLEGEAAAGPDEELLGDDGLPLQLSDTPYNRAAMALKRRYGEDRGGFASAFYRFRALMELISKDALGAWARSSIRRQGALRIHPAVLDVASDMRLSKNGKFAMKKFLAEVEIVARERYPALAEWQLEEE
ncbi:MAG: hypothetical protein OEM98_11875 [Gammaproteobacteria bacterium]|nr:hypothetical protein [Gammaproteobacteria bacterium]